MARVRGKNTRIEQLMFAELEKRGIKFSTHEANLAGRPDIRIDQSDVLVFIDGDFWHGRRYDSWKHKLTTTWSVKIENNIRRDRRQRAKLRRQGWYVLRLWGTDILKDPEKCAEKILSMQRRFSKGSNSK